ncbi:Fc.00g093410.m01.CDS01 [Cosmosporella sp. VM-42]
MVYTCGTCSKEFYTGIQARNQHCAALLHELPCYECDGCDEFFDDEDDRRNHMDYHGHWGIHSSGCRVCYNRFPGITERDQHEIEIHQYCAECLRFFESPNNIQQHLNSARHRSSTVSCPFCGEIRGTASGLAHHVEHSACPKAPLDRDKLFRVIRAHDPDGCIANQTLEWEGTKSYEATMHAWNEDCKAFQCYLCHSLYKSLPSLNQHLSSPTHQQTLYHCPNQFICKKEFRVLASLLNHLESESCSYMRFQTVQKRVHHVIKPGRMIEL